MDSGFLGRTLLISLWMDSGFLGRTLLISLWMDMAFLVAFQLISACPYRGRGLRGQESEGDSVAVASQPEAEVL